MPKPILLGLMPPLTGIVGMYGPEIVWAAQIACEEVNEAGGVLGRPLEVAVEDDGSLPETAVPAARRLLDNRGCTALVGNLLSNSRIAVAAHVADLRRVPYLNFSFYEGSIHSRYFFHFAALPNQQIDKMIPYMVDHYGHKMFFAGNNYEWPRGSIDAAKRALRKEEGEIVGEEYLSIGADIFEIHRLLDRVAGSGADVFVPYFAGEDQVALLTHFAGRGLKKRMAVVMGHFDEVMARRLSGGVREGFYSVNTYYMSLDTEENRKYIERLRRFPGVRGVWPRGEGVMSNFGEGAYICVKAFAEAVRRAGSLAAEALVDALETVEVTGPQGRVCMDPETHHASVNTYLARCQTDGSFEIVEKFGLNAPRLPARYQTTTAFRYPLSGIAAETSRLTEFSLNYLEEMQKILLSVDVAIVATDAQGLITELNTNCCEMFGYTHTEMLGMSVHLLVPPHFRKRHEAQFQEFLTSSESKRRMAQRGEVTGYRKDGTFFPIEVALAKFEGRSGWILVATIRDISERKHLEDTLRKRNQHDELTQLANRDLLRERVANALKRAHRYHKRVALLLIDIDHFKNINDTCGHMFGDSFLQIFALRLLENVRRGDTVARFSGDTFAVLCERVSDPQEVYALGDRLAENLKQPFDIFESSVIVTVSIGISIGQGPTHSVEDMLRFADTAANEAKQQGRDQWQVFNAQLQDTIHRRLTMVQGLRFARQLKELSYRFQPILSLETEQVEGVELLLRWHPSTGEIQPAEFIPIAEMTGAIVLIGIDVFRAGCAAQAHWARRWTERAPYVSINLSARQLIPDLPDTFARILDETGANPAKLILEVTETALMSNLEGAIRILDRLVTMGLQVAIDDFGTGYSSLSQLTRLPIRLLKIDRSLIAQIHAQTKNQVVIRTVINLGREIGLKVVVEGVETNDQLAFLKQCACDSVQGFYFARPLTEDQFIEYFENKELKNSFN